ncbi:ATP-binding protein [Vibrio cionasavignyae]|uniref:ATP-binding protein n=1 Tax=Vibrio cionasavignyae TaxID=2910252 RepID=UPI003D0E1C6D
MRNYSFDYSSNDSLDQTQVLGPPLLLGNALDLTQEMACCESIIHTRLHAYFEAVDNRQGSTSFSADPAYRDGAANSVCLPAMPAFNQSQQKGAYSDFIAKSRLSTLARMALALSVASEIRPALLEMLLLRNDNTGLPFSEFGVVMHHERAYPTGETLAFLLGGSDLIGRFQIQLFLEGLQNDNRSTTPDLQALRGVIELNVESSLGVMQAPLRLSDEALQRFTTATPFRPECSDSFPARYIDVDVDWDQLVLPTKVLKQVEEIQDYIAYGDRLASQWGFKGKIRPGYRALFFGPPGTGKTLTACLLGHVTGRDVYRVDISLVVSKYIGETEKNLEKVFSMAENKQWILLFDEADALFGKRNQANTANDQFANQNVAYLLQRIEAFNGVAILASNLKDNLDDAFYRRFESMVYFPLPDEPERLALWRNGFSDFAQLEESIDLPTLANKYTLSGANIMNVIRYASMQSIRRVHQADSGVVGAKVRYDIHLQDLEYGITRELEAFASGHVVSDDPHSDLFK